MPEIYHRSVKAESVRDALSEMRGELLPKEIRNDALARWVLNFDELRSARPPEFLEKQRKRDDEFPVWIIEGMLSAALERQIPFYFASLFHIGRQWSVSERSLKALRKANTRDNLMSSARLTAKSLSERASLSRGLQQIVKSSPEELAGKLVPLLEAARFQHDVRMSEARRWWKAWQKEVTSLRNQVAGIQESGRDIRYDRFWQQVAMMSFQSQRPSNLRLSMQASGVQFKTEGISSQHSGLGLDDAVVPLMLAAIASSGGDLRSLRYFDRYAEHYFHDVLREAHYRPLREAAMRRLYEKYHASEPFDAYRPLKKPASEQLKDLIAEHTLPGNEPSPWLSVWQDCLAPEPSSWSKFSEGDVTDFNTIAAFAASADSTIKKGLRQEEIELGEPWARYMQRLFESWLHDLAQAAATRHKEAKDSKTRSWEVKDFTILAESVAGHLTKIGYQLTLPTEERLKLLWEALHSEKPGDTSDW